MRLSEDKSHASHYLITRYMVFLGDEIDANHDFFDVILINAIGMQGFVFLSEMFLAGTCQSQLWSVPGCRRPSVLHPGAIQITWCASSEAGPYQRLSFTNLQCFYNHTLGHFTFSRLGSLLHVDTMYHLYP